MKSKWNILCNKIHNNQLRIIEAFLNKNKRKDTVLKFLVYFASMLTIATLLVLVGFIIYKSVYFFSNYGFFNFIAGKQWDSNNAEFGIWKIIISTFFILVLSLSLAIPLTIFSSLFIMEYLSNKWRRRIINIVQLLAGIPSVVFGLFSLSILGPIFMDLGAPAQTNLIITCITLAFMSLPIMISLSIHAIEAVPSSARYGALALGLSKTLTTFKVVFKYAKPKIIAAIMLGIARIIGETMAVMMICGNNANGLDLSNGFLKFIFSAVASLASTIGLEMLENSGPLHESALYSIGLILFIIVTIINLGVLGMQAHGRRNQRINKKSKIKNKFLITESNRSNLNNKEIHNLVWDKADNNKKIQKVKDNTLYFIMVCSTLLVTTFTLTIVAVILWKGLFLMHWGDLISISTYNGGAGILSAALVTVLLVVCCLLFSIPLSLLVAIYLNEYSDKNSWFNKFLRFIIEVISSTPSIVFGAFGLAFFIGICHMSLSIFVASLTLTIVVLPMMIRNIEDGLSFVPNEMRNSSFALGVPKSSTITKVVIPKASGPIFTSIILSISRIIGESAPVYLTLGTAIRLPTAGFLSPGASMTTEILMLWKEGSDASAIRIMYELSFAIMTLILFFNTLAQAVSKRLDPEYQNEKFIVILKRKYSTFINVFTKIYGRKSKAAVLQSDKCNSPKDLKLTKKTKSRSKSVDKEN